jgi:hypothetical protein
VTAGAPERLKPFERRLLTAGELAIAALMFDAPARFTEVRIWQLPRLGFGAMAPRADMILYAQWRAPRDFAAAPLAERGWFVHELTHIWQALNGAFMPLAKLGALGASAYRYRFDPAKPFAAYNIEQQAEIARHLFLARSGAPAPDAPARTALEAIWPGRPAQLR